MTPRTTRQAVSIAPPPLHRNSPLPPPPPQLLHEATRLQTQLSNQRQTLDKAKKNYEKSAREAEKVNVYDAGLFLG